LFQTLFLPFKKKTLKDVEMKISYNNKHIGLYQKRKISWLVDVTKLLAE
jgi:hypothetical protein